MEKEGLIAAFRQFAPISEADADFLRARFWGLTAPAKHCLVQPDEICQHVFYVVKGCVRVAIMDRSGDDITCYFAAEGQFVSNYESFLTGKPSKYALHCLEACELLAIDRQGIQELYTRTSQGERIGRMIAEHLFIDTVERLTSFYSETPEDRYQQFLREYPHLVQRIPQHYIAAYIGVRPQSLSRIKRRALSPVPR